ncbi:myb/SANT-like DNA-binding domain-containing protein 3 [Amblyomma americanum]
MEKTEKGKINFSRVERDLLLDLVDKHKAVLENKRTDAVSVARKRKEWELIETQFNSSHNVSPRTWLQLKKCWENWKNKWRKAKADDNREIFKTGGGSAAPSQLTEDLQRVGSVASHMGVRLANPFDSDRHQADPGGESQPAPSVAALLSRTQDGSIPGASDHRDKLAKRAAVHQLEMENLKLKNDLKRSKKILLELQIKAVKGEL